MEGIEATEAVEVVEAVEAAEVEAAEPVYTKVGLVPKRLEPQN